jgi:hypothetical protein
MKDPEYYRGDAENAESGKRMVQKKLISVSSAPLMNYSVVNLPI